MNDFFDILKKNKKIIIFMFLIILSITANYKYDFAKYISTENLNVFKKVINDNILFSGFVYILISTALSVILFLPGISFAVVAAYLFGAFYGTIFCTFAATLSSILSFLISRYFLKDKIKPLISKNKYIKKYLFDDIYKNQLYILMITRLIPLFPFNLQNFAYGITDMNILIYSIGTFLFILPGTAIYTVGVAGFSNENKRYIYLTISFVLFILVFLFTKILEKRLGIKGSK